MKKIGLISVHNPNYGSMLQTYALHTYLKSIGYDNEIILYTKKNGWKQFVRLFNLSLLVMKGRVVYRDLYCRIFQKEIYNGLLNRIKKFDEFKYEYFSFSYNHIGWNTLLKCNDEYDIFILGSDQVWNPINIGTDFFNLLFVEDRKYKITYAPSFGVSSIPLSQKTKTINYLNKIQVLSTREVAGQKIIKELTGRDVPVVCDPTLLIDRIYWDELKGTNRFIEEKYIFCYFLGNNISHRDFAKRLGMHTGYKLVALQHLDEFVKSDVAFGDMKPFNVGPAEFVNLISNAEYILTDSFHGTIFSMLYRKQFFIFSRYENKTNASTNSRIDSLLNLVGATERHIKSDINLEECLSLDMDYDVIHQKISEYQKLSRNYLCNALSILK